MHVCVKFQSSKVTDMAEIISCPVDFAIETFYSMKCLLANFPLSVGRDSLVCTFVRLQWHVLASSAIRSQLGAIFDRG